jgi:hypothetical protein
MLALPSLELTFHFFVNVNKGVAFGLLIQKTWGQHQPVAFLSKFLDPVTSGWPQRIQAIVVIKVFLAEESRKITFGRSLVSTPHQVRTILNQKVER